MADSFSKERRSYIMSKIKSKNTKLEIGFRRHLWKRGFHYRLHYNIDGKPDIVFASRKVAIFIDSCFWHGCSKHLRLPHSNIHYWKAKIGKNIKRDNEVNRILKRDDWEVLRFWEHDIKKNSDRCIDKITRIFNAYT